MTSLQVIDTGEVVEQMTRVEAERITARIADKLDGIADNIEQVMPLIRDALTREAWRPLGYSGATAYVSERFAGAFGRLPAAVRQPIVSELSSAGMSTRAIAPIVGASHMTVQNDRISGVKSFTPGPTPEFVDTRTGEIHDGFQDAIAKAEEEVVEPARKVHGMDGKTYSRIDPTETPKPRAEAVTAQFTTAVVELNRVLDRFHRIQDSGNFAANKNQVAALHGNDLDRAISELKNLAESLH